ncbi:hypothetical protein Cgig2_000905 [Carnegiea gigantea]|uniref:Uncharacterized protein n=1 Tax=Carnegiea gigantea TaxID=171969 RepID=A0A9Q1KMH1_9CARY|nr:hypothetical protein Cgig2_000905 [Carnegiea gigantea]
MSELISEGAMQGSSSSRRGDHEQAIVMYRRCNIEEIRKVSHSSQNPGRMYAEHLRCEKFLGRVDEANPNLEKRLLSSKSSSSSNEKLSDSSDPSACHSIKATNNRFSLGGWGGNRLEAILEGDAGLGLLAVGVEFGEGVPFKELLLFNFIEVQPNPVIICGKWPTLVFFTRRMPSKLRKLRQLHSIFHN